MTHSDPRPIVCGTDFSEAAAKAADVAAAIAMRLGEAWRVRAGAVATGFLRGNKEINMPLQFVRFEPYVIPKTSLTGESTERVDTRVLQVVFNFDRRDLPIFVGQQMDVFIDASQPLALPMRTGSIKP